MRTKSVECPAVRVELLLIYSRACLSVREIGEEEGEKKGGEKKGGRRKGGEGGDGKRTYWFLLVEREFERG